MTPTATYLDNKTRQFILVIRGFYSLLPREPDLDVCGTQIRLSSLAERIVQLHFDSVRESDSGPCSLGIRHANMSGGKAIEGPSREDVQVVDEQQ